MPEDEDNLFLKKYMEITESKRKLSLDGQLKEKLPSLYGERNRDQIFLTLEKSKDHLKEFFPDENEATYEALKRRITIEQISIFCKACEDLGAIVFSVEKSEGKEDFWKYLASYGPKDVCDFYRDFRNSELEELRERIKRILNLPSKENLKPLDGDELELIPEDSDQPSEKKKSSRKEALDRLEKTYKNFYNKISEISELYFEYRDFYLAYKHGYRISFGTTETKIPTPEGEIPLETELSNKDAFSYIDSNNEDKLLIVSEEEVSDLSQNCADVDKIIKLIMDNQFAFKEENKFRNFIFKDEK